MKCANCGYRQEWHREALASIPDGTWFPDCPGFVPAPAASRPSAEPSEAATLLDVLPDAADPIWETHARMCGSPNPLLFHREFCRVLVALSARPAAGSETRCRNCGEEMGDNASPFCDPSCSAQARGRE
jgi:hypothetical protein